jgi:hypothetical protein
MTQKVLSEDKLTFVTGHADFPKDEFVKRIQPFFKDLQSHGRDNWLFVATHGDGTKDAVTGYRTNTTIDVTINKYAIKSDKSGGKWAVFKLD